MAGSGEERGAMLVDAVRTPYGARGGALSTWHPVDLAAQVLTELMGRNAAPADAVDCVILGCATQVGAQAGNVARRAVLAAGWDERVPGETIQCGSASSVRAVHHAAEAVMSGAEALVVAGGVEVATLVPPGADLAQRVVGKPYGERLRDRYRGGGGLLPPGLVAEEVARRWSLTRAALDAWALGSYEKARRAQRRTPGFLVPIGASLAPGGAKAPAGSRARKARGTPASLARDEALGRSPSAGELAALLPLSLEGGVVTAGNMAAEGDGASAVLVASPAMASALSLVPKARFVSLATAGGDPAAWPEASVAATAKALEHGGLSSADVGVWHVHESSAAAVLAWIAATGVAPRRVNPCGGALATAAPSGAVGAGLFAPALAELAESDNGYFAVVVAGEGGVATACILERVQ